jgi:hypothetical protein
MGNINEHFMESQFLRRGSRSGLPAVGEAAKAPPGHLFVDWVDSSWFTNEGTPDSALYTGPGRHHSLIERFEKRPALNAVIALDETSNAAAYLARNLANKDWEAQGTNMTTALATFADGGGVKLTTAGAADDQAIITPHLDTNQSAWAAWKWNTNDECIFECVIEIGDVTELQTIFAGFKLTNAAVIATDNDQAAFFFSGNDATWSCVSSNNGTDDTTVSSVAVASSINYHLKIVVDSARVPRFYVNGVLAATGDALKADVDLKPFIGIHASDNTEPFIIVRCVRCGKTLND